MSCYIYYMQCGGVAGSCKMATSDDGGVLLGGVEWSSSPVTFHRNKGKHVELTESNTVATRTESHSGLVFTSEPIVVGQMFKVTMTVQSWLGGDMVRAHLVCALFNFIKLKRPSKYATPSILGNFLTSKNCDSCIDNYSFMSRPK